LQLAAFGRGPRIPIVNESDAVADENFRFDNHPFANKSVTRNLASLADPGSLLNFHEGANFRVIANLAAV
jgi:hypothetical protein